MFFLEAKFFMRKKHVLKMKNTKVFFRIASLLTGQAGVGWVKPEGVLLVVGEAGEAIAQEVQGAQAHQTVSGHLGPAKKYVIYNTVQDAHKIIGHLVN